MHIKTVKEMLAGALDSLRGLLLDLNLDRLSEKRTLVGVVFIFIGSHLYYRRKFSFWSRRKLKGPSPCPIFGNELSFFFTPRKDLEHQWARKHGRLYGMYYSNQPILVCADAAIMKKICIKDFDKFVNRMFVADMNKYQRYFMLGLEDDRWRGVRIISSPTFSTGKMKQIFQLLKSCTGGLIEEYRKIIEENGGEAAVVDTMQVFNEFTLKSSVRSFYGINLDSKSLVETFLQMIRKATHPRVHRVFIHALIPKLLLKLFYYPIYSDAQMEPLGETVRNIVENRRGRGKSFNDYLQMLINAKSDDAPQGSEESTIEAHHTMDMASPSRSSGPSKQKLTEQEVCCNAMLFMFVAADTTAIHLSHTVYLLAHHQDIQERLYRELSKIRRAELEDEFDYESVTSCVYLDCVVSESLRLMPPAYSLDRVAGEDYYIEEHDLLLPKGTPVLLSFAAIMRDPEYWPQPDTFDPERFAPENKSKIVPGSYCPFGIGPRACIGFRFALTEAKQALASLVTSLKFEKAPGTKYPAEARMNTYIINYHNDLRVIVKARV